MSISTQHPPKLRWGDMDEDDVEDLDFLRQPKQVMGTDKGIKRHLSKRALERRKWPKFGDAVREDVGSCLTIVSTEEILFERPRAPGSKPEETMVAGDPLAQIGKGGAVLMVCRTCGKKGDHWTSRCTYKDLAAPFEGFNGRPAPSDTATAAADTATAAAGRGGAYVPPGMRAGAERTRTDMMMTRRNDGNSVRVTNLSEDTREPDLLDLFRPFGAVSRVYVAVDQKMGKSRGFGFVNFVSKEDAERAIDKLNGYGYDNLILKVEWAAPRTN